jgi:hypothetical protein
MDPESYKKFITFGKVFLQIVGVTSIFGLIGIVTAYYALPPNLAIEEVKDKGKYNFESRFVVKNIGKLPAFNIISDISNMNMVIGGMNFKNLNTTNCGRPITKLASDEVTEIPAVPHMGMPVRTSITSCDYNLTLKYELHLPFFKTIIEKKWFVELRNAGDEYTWQIALR